MLETLEDTGAIILTIILFPFRLALTLVIVIVTLAVIVGVYSLAVVAALLGLVE